MFEQLQKIQPQRNQVGCWTHPVFQQGYNSVSHGDERLTAAQYNQLEKLLDHDLTIVEIFDQISEEKADRLLKGDLSVVAAWEPIPPNDHAFLVSIHEVDDGFVAWWATPKTTNDKPINEVQIAFEKAEAAKHGCDYDELKANFDKSEKLTGHRYPPTSSRYESWLVWQEAWQAAQEQMSTAIFQKNNQCGFFSYDGHNYIHHDTLLQAKIEADSAIDHFRDKLFNSNGGFHPLNDGNFQHIGYGIILGRSTYSVDHIVTQKDVDAAESPHPVGTEIISLDLTDLIDMVKGRPFVPGEQNASLALAASTSDSNDYVLVPKEPTQDMILNALAVIATGIGTQSLHGEICMLWSKMLDAATQKA